MKKVFTKQMEPVIYFRFQNNVLMYIGETHDLRNGRPFRTASEITLCNKKSLKNEKSFRKKDRNGNIYETYIGDYDKVITIKASRDVNRRRYWEASLIIKLQPFQQNIKYYNSRLKRKNFSVNEKEQIEMEKTKKWEVFKKNNKKKIIKILLTKKLYALKNLISAEKCLRLVRQERNPTSNEL
jgi:hypothetical protein